MKKIKFLLLGIVSILGIGFSSASFTISGVTYEDGFYRNQTKGLITVINGENIATLHDKNLGATTVYDGTINSYGGTINSIRYNLKGDCSQIGNLYQRGNNYGFDCTLPDVFYPFSDSPYILLTGYDYNNPINSSVPYFNRNNYDISNIWGGVTATPSAQQGPCDYGFYVPTNNDWSNFLNMLNDLVPSSNINTTEYMQKILYYLKFPFISYTQNYSVINYMSAQNVAGIFGYPQSRSNSISFSIPLNSNSYDSLPYYVYTGDYQETFYLSPVRCFKNVPVLPSNTWVSLDGENDTSILPPEVDQPEPNNPWGSGYFPYGIYGTKSLFYYCNVQMSSYDSAFCYNSDGSRKSDDELKNCYVSNYVDGNNGEEFSEFYCIDERGLIQNIDVQIEGSGSVFAPCESGSCQFTSVFGDLGMTGFTSEFFDEYLNTTGYFFKCPWPYDNKLTIRPKLITLLNGVDILLPINCGIAGFSYGKNIFTFENSGHFVPNGPLLHFEGDNRILLYYFFDILISFGIIIFAGKIFYLFHK